MADETKNEKISDLFKGYIQYSDEEYNRIWDSSIITIDTNILLNFYRYSSETKTIILSILNSVKDRLWIPFQVAKEYFSNRDKVMTEAYKKYDSILSDLSSQFDKCINSLNEHSDRQLKCKDEITKLLMSTKNKINAILSKEKTTKKPKFENNSVEKKILDLLNSKIGTPYDEKEYSEIYAEGKRRTIESIPPGYKDKDKEENGDYFIFYSLMEKAKQEKKDVIFITDDVKEDWFNKVNGEKHGGRYELLNEFYTKTNQLILIYSSDGFVDSYNKKYKKESNKEIIDELKDIRRNDLKMYETYLNYGKSFIKDTNIISMLYSFKDYIQTNRDHISMQFCISNLNRIIRYANLDKTKKANLLYLLEVFETNSYKLDRLQFYNYLFNTIDDMISSIKYTSDIESKESNFIINLRKGYEELNKNLQECNDSNQIHNSFNDIHLKIAHDLESIKSNNIEADNQLLINLINLQMSLRHMLSHNSYTLKEKYKVLKELDNIILALNSEVVA